MPDDGDLVPPRATPAAPVPEAPPAAPRQLRFRVDPRLTAVRVGGVVVFVLFALVFGSDPGTVAVCGIAALTLGGYALRDLVAPHRLIADPAGLTLVSGYLGRRRLSWAEIERVRMDERRRLGVRSELLEVDTGDHLHLLSGYDLGVPVRDAVVALAALAPPGLTQLPSTDY